MYYIYTYICIIYIHIHMSVYIHICIYIYIYTYACTYCKCQSVVHERFQELYLLRCHGYPRVFTPPLCQVGLECPWSSGCCLVLSSLALWTLTWYLGNHCQKIIERGFKPSANLNALCGTHLCQNKDPNLKSFSTLSWVSCATYLLNSKAMFDGRIGVPRSPFQREPIWAQLHSAKVWIWRWIEDRWQTGEEHQSSKTSWKKQQICSWRVLAAPWWVLGRTSRNHGCPKHHLIISMHTNFLVILGWKVSKKAGCAMARNCSLGNLPSSGENYCTEDGSTVRFAAHWISQCTASWCGWKDPTYCKADQNWNWMELTMFVLSFYAR